MVFSTNQNRQLYVANGVSAETTYAEAIADIKGTLGKVCVSTDKNGCKFITQNGYGGLVRSDLIDPKSIMWATATGPKDTEIKLKAYALELKSTVGSGNPIAGQDYIVRINFRQMYGMSDEDIYLKYGAVHAKEGGSAGKPSFFKEMAYSLIKNFNRLYSPLLYVGLADATNFTLIKSAAKDTSGNITFTYIPAADLGSPSGYQASAIASPTKLIIAEMSQVNEWQLGTKQYTPVYFQVIPTTIDDTTGTNTVFDVEWGTVTDFSTTYNQTVPNGYKYADLEYFCMGERGDLYRNVGWPKVIQTKYFVNPANTYYSLDIHYAYQGTCEDIQKSEKTITILATAKATIDSIITKLGIGDKVHATDLYDGTPNNISAYPTASAEQAQIDALGTRVDALENP